MSVFGDIIQSGSVTNGSSKSQTPAWTWGSATGAGNLLVIVIFAEAATTTGTPTITGAAGWSAAMAQAGSTAGANSDPVGRMFYIDNSGSRSGTETWTNALSVSSNWQVHWFEIYTGGSSPLDSAASSATSGGSFLASTITSPATGTRAQADEFLIGALVAKNNSRTFNNSPTNSFVQRTTAHDTFATASQGISGACYTQLVSATTDTTCADTINTSSNWATLIGCFKKPAAGGTLFSRTASDTGLSMSGDTTKILASRQATDTMAVSATLAMAATRPIADTALSVSSSVVALAARKVTTAALAFSSSLSMFAGRIAADTALTVAEALVVNAGRMVATDAIAVSDSVAMAATRVVADTLGFGDRSLDAVGPPPASPAVGFYDQTPEIRHVQRHF